MSIYDNYLPTSNDITIKVEKVSLPRSQKRIKTGFAYYEAKAEVDPSYVTPDLKAKYMGNQPLVNNVFAKLLK